MTNRPDNSLVFNDQPSAEAAAELLREAGVPAEVEVSAPVPGLVEDVRVVVAEGFLARAREVLRSADISERELTRLATGESGESGNDGERDS